jgi:hypothetical protein
MDYFLFYILKAQIHKDFQSRIWKSDPRDWPKKTPKYIRGASPEPGAPRGRGRPRGSKDKGARKPRGGKAAVPSGRKPGRPRKVPVEEEEQQEDEPEEEEEEEEDEEEEEEEDRGRGVKRRGGAMVTSRSSAKKSKK